jgi:hypothetical protein
MKFLAAPALVLMALTTTAHAQSPPRSIKVDKVLPSKLTGSESHDKLESAGSDTLESDVAGGNIQAILSD